MSILDKITNMFGQKDEAEVPAPAPDEGAGAPVDAPAEEPAPTPAPEEGAAPEAPEISPQPDVITPEGEGEEPVQEEKAGEGKINL